MKAKHYLSLAILLAPTIWFCRCWAWVLGLAGEINGNRLGGGMALSVVSIFMVVTIWNEE